MNIRSTSARRRLVAAAALATAGWLALGAASAAADTSAHRPLGAAGAHVASGNGSGRGSGPSSGSGASAGPRQQPPARGPVIKVSKGARWS